MPKVSLPDLPVSALFAVAKPSGPTSMAVINDIKQLVASSRLFVEAEKLDEQKRNGKSKGFRGGKRARDTVKIGQGGTLDPLADGVLVVGVGKGTKRLNDLLEGVKVRMFTFRLV
jgi:tRNA pseudouridine55 synthase